MASRCQPPSPAGGKQHTAQQSGPINPRRHGIQQPAEQPVPMLHGDNVGSEESDVSGRRGRRNIFGFRACRRLRSHAESDCVSRLAQCTFLSSRAALSGALPAPRSPGQTRVPSVASRAQGACVRSGARSRGRGTICDGALPSGRDRRTSRGSLCDRRAVAAGARETRGAGRRSGTIARVRGRRPRRSARLRAR
jgi:hypothetical protein